MNEGKTIRNELNAVQTKGKTRKNSFQTPKWLTGVFFTFPGIIIMAATILYPLLWALKISFSSSDSVVSGTTKYVGFANYINVLTSSDFLQSLWNTTGFVVVTIVIELGIGLLISVMLSHRFPGNKLFVIIFSLPLLMAPIVTGFMWKWLFADQYGIINYFLSFFGVKNVLWFGTPFMAKTAILIANIWSAVPFVILVLFAAISGIPDEINEAARIDGANGWTLFRYVTLPLLKPAILLVLVVRLSDAFRMYDLVYILTGGGPGGTTTVLNTYIYRRTFSDFKFGDGSAASFIVTIIIMLISFVSIKIFGPKKGDAV